jgi:hypothetical protein
MDMVDYLATCSMHQAKSLLDIAPDLKVITGDYLERGEIDLAMGIRKKQHDHSGKRSPRVRAS